MEVEALKYSRILAYLPNGVREAASQTKVSHSTMSRLKRGMIPDIKTMLTLMDWAQATEITFTRHNLIDMQTMRQFLKDRKELKRKSRPGFPKRPSSEVL
jgi:transcriptional regulator with XRE-family HTH domain